jgi:hypothetical protein
MKKQNSHVFVSRWQYLTSALVFFLVGCTHELRPQTLDVIVPLASINERIPLKVALFMKTEERERTHSNPSLLYGNKIHSYNVVLPIGKTLENVLLPSLSQVFATVTVVPVLPATGEYDAVLRPAISKTLLETDQKGGYKFAISGNLEFYDKTGRNLFYIYEDSQSKKHVSWTPQIPDAVKEIASQAIGDLVKKWIERLAASRVVAQYASETFHPVVKQAPLPSAATSDVDRLPTPAVRPSASGSFQPVAKQVPLPSGATGDVDRLPTVTAKPRKNAYAVVIGIEQYREKLPKADFADKDAKLVGEYLTKVLGYPEENVIIRLNDRATRTDFVKYFEEWLKNNVEPGGSVFVYYSGHGAPNTKTGEAYLVPYDGDPSFVDSTAYPVKQMYAALDKLPAKDVTVVLDSCFSGAGGRSVLAKGARPMVLSIENPVLASGKTIVLAASGGDQISNSFEEKGHGLLTYFFLKGLQGEGDVNKDGVIEMVELYDYVKPNVQRIARKQYNSEQTPQLLASPDVLKRGGGRLVERPHP